MRCRNCGAAVTLSNKFCPECGVCLESDIPRPDSPQEKAENQNELKKSVMDALNNTFSSAQFLIMCIFLSVAVAVQVFLMKDSLNFSGEGAIVLLIHVMPLLAMIFLWITYANARNSSLSYSFTSIKVLDKLAKIQTIIGWLTAIGIVALLIFTNAQIDSIEDADLDELKKSAEALSTITKIVVMVLLSGSMYNVLTFFVGLGIGAALFLDDSSGYYSATSFLNGKLAEGVGTVVVFASVLLVLVTILFTRNFKKTSEAIIMCAETGRPYYGNFGIAEVGSYIMAGVMVLFLILTDEETTATILYASYGGFLITSGLTIRKLSYELRSIND